MIKRRSVIKTPVCLIPFLGLGSSGFALAKNKLSEEYTSESVTNIDARLKYIEPMYISCPMCCASQVIAVAGVSGLGAGIGAVYSGGVMFAVPITIIAAGTAAIVTYISDGACR